MFFLSPHWRSSGHEWRNREERGRVGAEGEGCLPPAGLLMDAGLLGLRGGQPGPEPGYRVAATCRSSHTHTPVAFITVFSQTTTLLCHHLTSTDSFNVSRGGNVFNFYPHTLSHTHAATHPQSRRC